MYNLCSKLSKFRSVRSMYKFDPLPGDIMVAGAPKTGTTWIQQILHQIRTKGDETFSDIYEVTWWLPYKFNKFEFDYNQKQPFGPPRILKTHELFEEAPIAKDTKVIVLVRNNLDAAWSFLKFMPDFFGKASDEVPLHIILPPEEPDPTRDRVMKSLGALAYFIASWWPHRNDPNVLWIHYEDLKKDLRYCIAKIAKFIEIPVTDQELDRIYSFSTFEYMAQHFEKFKGDMVKKQMALYLGKEEWKSEVGMIRIDGGQIGQGASGLSPEVAAKFQKVWERICTPVTGCKNYDELYKTASLLRDRNK